MIVKKVSFLVAVAAMICAPTANAKSAPAASRLAAPISSANYQNDSEDDVGPMAVILVLVVAILIGLAAVSGGGEPESP